MNGDNNDSRTLSVCFSTFGDGCERRLRLLLISQFELGTGRRRTSILPLRIADLECGGLMSSERTLSRTD